MSTTRRLARTIIAAAGCLAALPALASDPPVTDATTLATLDKVTTGDWRSPENRARDIWRHPKETLKFFGFRQDMTVLEIWPGGGGWYTEILAPALREHGHYIAAGQDPASTSQYTQGNIKKFAEKLAKRLYRNERSQLRNTPEQCASLLAARRIVQAFGIDQDVGIERDSHFERSYNSSRVQCPMSTTGSASRRSSKRSKARADTFESASTGMIFATGLPCEVTT